MSQTIHDKLYEALRNTGPIAELLLLARLADDRLELDQGDSGPLRVFIPDLHLLPPGQIGVHGNQWNYSTNGLPHLRHLLVVLKQLREDIGKQRLEVVVLGDLVDLWRHGKRKPDAILESHADIIGALRDDNDALDAHLLYGNHDIELSLVPALRRHWRRRLYLPVGSENPRCLALHGDIFDWIERLSVPVKTFFLTIFGRQVGEGEANLTHLPKLRQTAGLCNDLLSPTDWAAVQTSAATRPTPTVGSFNSRRANEPAPHLTHRFLGKAREHARWAEEQFGERLRSMVIGHTHQVGIGVLDRPNDFFALFDCGAWIGAAKLRVGDEIKRVASAQIGVQAGNDFRIYQVVGQPGTELELTNDS